MSKSFVVDRTAFLNNFLAPIIKMGAKTDYLSFEWGDEGDREALKTLVPFENSVFLLASHVPIRNSEDVGDPFFLREPQRLRDVFSLMPDDYVPLQVDTARLHSKTKAFKMSYMLIDPIIGSRGTGSVISTERAKEFEPVEMFTLDKKTLARIKKTVTSFRDPKVIVGFEKRDDSVWVHVEHSGEEVEFDLGITTQNKFKRFDFSCIVFTMLDAKAEVVVSRNKNNKVLFMDIDHEDTQLKYIITQKKEQ